MDQNKETVSLINLKRLSANEDYYNNVFKKTERIVSAVFYILSYIPYTETTRVHHQSLSDKATTLHNEATASLRLFEHDVVDGLYPLQHALVVLESSLTLLSGARLLSPTVASPIDDEIDQTLRHLRHHYLSSVSSLATPTSHRSLPSSSGEVRRAGTPRRSRPNIPKNDMSSDAILVYSDLSDRTTRIKTVLEAKPEATIKDLTDIITDVSSKTIQRDLNSLIEQGQVIRQGERRWSKYSLA
jgi:DNA-binding transcriptional ArsR family regulator